MALLGLAPGRNLSITAGGYQVNASHSAPFGALQLLSWRIKFGHLATYVS